MSRMTHRCERCPRVTDLYHCRSVDEYLCEDCIDLLADEENDEPLDPPGWEGGFAANH